MYLTRFLAMQLDGASVSRLISGPLEALGEISCQMDVKIVSILSGIFSGSFFIRDFSE